MLVDDIKVICVVLGIQIARLGPDASVIGESEVASVTFRNDFMTRDDTLIAGAAEIANRSMDDEAVRRQRPLAEPVADPTSDFTRDYRL
ncbi:MAG: hypothetical protein P4L90_11505 [Rhodopila sp.]|nr:hypothetical protein [Rhodopila sp.]